MARPVVRKFALPKRDAEQLRWLFGNTINAYRRLGLEERGVGYGMFYRMVTQRRPVRQEYAELVADAWLRWRWRFLKATTALD